MGATLNSNKRLQVYRSMCLTIIKVMEFIIISVLTGIKTCTCYSQVKLLNEVKNTLNEIVHYLHGDWFSGKIIH